MNHLNLKMFAGYFGLSKAEQEALVFANLVEAGQIDLDDTSFNLSLRLRIPQSKVNSLVHGYRLQRSNFDSDLKLLGQKMRFVSFEDVREKVVFSVEDKYFRELLVAQLKQAGIFSDTSFSRELVIVPFPKLGDLFECLGVIDDDSVLEDLRLALKKAKVEDLKALGLGALGSVYSMAAQLCQEIIVSTMRQN